MSLDPRLIPMTPDEIDAACRLIEDMLEYVPLTAEIRYQKCKESLPNLMYSFRSLSSPDTQHRIGFHEGTDAVVKLIEAEAKNLKPLSAFFKELIIKIKRLP